MFYDRCYYRSRPINHGFRVRFRCLRSSCNTWLNTCHLIKPEKRFGKCRKQHPIRRCAWNSVSFLWKKHVKKRFNGWKWSWGDFFLNSCCSCFFFWFFSFFFSFWGGVPKTTQCKVLQGHTGKKHVTRKLRVSSGCNVIYTPLDVNPEVYQTFQATSPLQSGSCSVFVYQ